MSEARVAFRYRPHRDEDDDSDDGRVMTLSPKAFLARYVAHISVPRLQAVRGYGLYGQRQAAALDCARVALAQTPVEEPQPLSAPQWLARLGHTPEIGRCPRCGALLLFSSLRAYATGPPTLAH